MYIFLRLLLTPPLILKSTNSNYAYNEYAYLHAKYICVEVGKWNALARKRNNNILLLHCNWAFPLPLPLSTVPAVKKECPADHQ